jgi:hypothetical protein
MKSSLTISHLNAELKTNVLEAGSVTIIMVNVRNDKKSLIQTPVRPANASALLTHYAL